MDTAVESIASHGILGAFCVILGVAVWRIYVQLQAVQASRVEDAQKVTETLLKLNDQWSSTVNELGTAVRELRMQIATETRRP